MSKVRNFASLAILLLATILCIGCLGPSKVNLPDGSSYTVLKNEDNRLIADDLFCNTDNDCLVRDNFCINHKSEKLGAQQDDNVKSSINDDTTSNDNCRCSTNKCIFSGEPFLWMRNNLPKNSSVMMWWDLGESVELSGNNPFIKAPSNSTAEQVAADCYFLKRAGQDCGKAYQFESDQKVNATAEFFVSTDLNKSLCIAYENNIDYVFIDSSMVEKFGAIVVAQRILNNLETKNVMGLTGSNNALSIGNTLPVCSLENVNSSKNAECKLEVKSFNETVVLFEEYVPTFFVQAYYYKGKNIYFLELVHEYSYNISRQLPVSTEKVKYVSSTKYLSYYVYKIVYPANVAEICKK